MSKLHTELAELDRQIAELEIRRTRVVNQMAVNDRAQAQSSSMSGQVRRGSIFVFPALAGEVTSQAAGVNIRW